MRAQVAVLSLLSPEGPESRSCCARQGLNWGITGPGLALGEARSLGAPGSLSHYSFFSSTRGAGP